MGKEKILFVDDEPRVLLGLYRSLSGEFNVSMAGSPEEALREMETKGPFAVVVSDLRMPGMDGVQFLTRAAVCWPDTVRVMLTGKGDLDAAMAAVNEGRIFQFLTKPCPRDRLAETLKAAIEQYRVAAAERDVLRQTLMGTITLLTDILSIVYPAAFRRSLRIRHCVQTLAGAFGLQQNWQLDAAAALSHIGCVTSPTPTSPEEAPGDEQRSFCGHEQVGAELLRRVPRLEMVADIIALQRKPFRECKRDAGGVAAHVTALGGQILRVAVDLESLTREGANFYQAIRQMRACEGEYNPEALRALEEAGMAPMDNLPANPH